MGKQQEMRGGCLEIRSEPQCNERMTLVAFIEVVRDNHLDS